MNAPILLLLGTLAFGQEETQEPMFPPVRTTGELVMKSFRPTNVSARVLYPVAEGFLGHDLVVRHQETNNTVKQRNLQLLGDTILVYDMPNAAESAVKIMAELDAGYRTRSEPEEPERVVREYAVRFLSLDAAVEALMPYTQSSGARNGAMGHRTASFVSERNVVVFHDTPERVEEMVEFLRRLDVPPPQGVLTCYLVKPSDGAGEGPALPKELVEGMRELMDYSNVEQVAVGLLRTSVTTRRPLSMRLDTSEGSYELNLQPGAYDANDGVLTLSECRLQAIASQATLFRTQTSVKSGEYTVLGASGMAPLFVVLHFRPLR